MELGEPDASGRRAPKPVEGKTETLDVDTVILAIGQAVDPQGFEGIELTRKRGIAYDKDTYMTSIEGVFAGGDCGNDKISIAVEAIADADKASEIIDAYLNGQKIKYEKPYLVERHDITEKTFEDRERQCRPKMDHLVARERKDNFTEIVFGYDADKAVEDSMRCLECGCHDYFECKLIKYANEYKVEPERFAGDVNKTDYEDDHPFIVRDPNKCILCGLCVRVCDEVMGIGALGLVHRGFDTVVKPTLEKPLAESGCVTCGQCVSVCPTGALGERLSIAKPVPLKTEVTNSTCPYCSVGCSLHLETYGDMLIKAVPNMEGAVNKGLLCGKGRFGFDCAQLEGKLIEPMIQKENGFEEVSYHEAFMTTAKKAQAIGAKYGKDAVAVAISDRYTNEEAYAIKKFADIIGARTLSFNNRKNGLAEVLGFDASPNTIDELLSTDVILVAGFNTVFNPIIQSKLKQAAEAGAKVVLINPIGYEQHFNFAVKTVYVKNDLSFLKEVAKALLDMGKKTDAEGLNEFAASISRVEASDVAKEIAELYGNAKKAMIVFQQNFATSDAAALLADIAVISGHIGSPRDGILMVKAKNNSQGLIDLGISAGAESLEGVKAILVFGEDPDVDLSGMEFIMVSDTHMTETAKKADVVIPGTAFDSTNGTFTNTERRLQRVSQAISEDVALSNWEIAAELAHVFELEMPFDDTDDIFAEMKDQIDKYKYAKIGEIYGGVLKPESPVLKVVGDAEFAVPLRSSDNLMNIISRRLPKPV